MQRSFKHFVAAGALIGLTAVGCLTATHTARAAAVTYPMRNLIGAADRAWVTAAAKSDQAATTKVLDADFTWTNSSGKTLTREEVLQNLPVPQLGDEAGAKTSVNTYGQVATVQVHSGKLHAIRVWVHRQAGWRLLVYQEVKQPDALPSVTPGTGKVCDNPCKSLGYTPKNAQEKEVATAYMELESAAVAKNADAWSARVSPEFIAVSSNSDKLLDKATRAGELRNAKMAGLAPTPLTSAKMYDFPGATVMVSLHTPDQGKPLHIIRVWAKQNGKWAEAVSYQTSIQDAAATK